jgi:hypothetical protein
MSILAIVLLSVIGLGVILFIWGICSDIKNVRQENKKRYRR